MSGGEVVAEFDAALAAAARPDATPLSAAEVEYLAEHGGPGVAEALADSDASREWDRQARAAINQTAFAAGANLSIAEAAARLGVDRSRVSHRLAQGTLWGFRVGRSPRLPRWQFTADGGLVPGLPQIIASIPEGLDPRSVAAFMTTARADLGGRTPLAHLADDGDPTVVAGLLAGLGQW
ncbi:MAG: hypothetical protein LBH76_04460 [Propionibacteriaceae bacterium]|nr:hypothetical protein [Propionibacteriaceae bacterium]